jgi:RNA polymerase sigma-70 factor (ECF subfamily)
MNLSGKNSNLQSKRLLLLNTPYDNENTLLSAVASGDEAAFKVLFDAFHTRLYNYILSLTKSKEVSEELVMDVFMKLWLGKETISEIENMDGFLFRIARNKSIDFLRAAAKDRKMGEFVWDKIQMPEHANPDQQLMIKEYEAKLRDAIDLMPPKRKEVYKLSRENGLKHGEIAKELNISENTVTNHIMQAQAFIRTYLLKNLDIVIIMTVLSGIKK